LVAAVQSVTVAAGYNTDINPDNVFDTVDALQGQQQTDAANAYPKVYVFSEGAKYSDLPSYRIHKVETFSVVAVFSAATVLPGQVMDLSNQVSGWIDDLEIMIVSQKQAGGADAWRIAMVADDLGANQTEAVVVAEIHCEYKRNLRIPGS